MGATEQETQSAAAAQAASSTPAREPATDDPGASTDQGGETRPPTIDELQGQFCPQCKTGVLYVTLYDPEARYERDQEIMVGRNFSGGSYHVECAQCQYHESRAMNPSEAVSPTTTVVRTP